MARQTQIIKKINEYLISQAKKPLNTKGMCQGFAKLWSYFTVRGQEELYWQHIAKIINYDGSNKELSIDEFIETVVALQEQEKCGLLPKLLGDNLGSGKKEYEFAWNFSIAEIATVLKNLVETTEKNKNNELKSWVLGKTVLITNLDHACALIYINNQYVFYDPNLESTIKTDDYHKIAESIHARLSFKIMNEEMCPLTLKVFTGITEKQLDLESLLYSPSTSCYYKEFFSDKLKQLQAINELNIDHGSINKFKIWVFYVIAIGNPSIYDLLEDAKLKKYNINYQMPKNTKSTQPEYVKAFYLTPQILFGDLSEATKCELMLRSEKDIEFLKTMRSANDEVNYYSWYYDATLLMQAAFLNKRDIIIELLQSGADINSLNREDLSALCFAILGGNIEICKILIEHGAKINSDGRTTPLRLSIQTKQLEICRILLENGADPNQVYVNNCDTPEYTPLSTVVNIAYTEFCELLLEFKADPNYKLNGNVLICDALYLGRDQSKEIFKLLLKNKADPNLSNKDGDTALHIIVRQDNFACFKILQEYKVNYNAINNAGNTALHEAMTYHKILFFDLNRVKKTNFSLNYNTSNNDGNTPLHLAVMKDCNIWCTMKSKILYCNLLINNGADINKKNILGKTPFFIAIERGEIELITFFLENGICKEKLQYKAFDANKNSLLHQIVKLQNEKVLKAWLDNSLVNAKNLNKDTPLHIAVQYGNVKIVSLLLAAGANPNIKNNLKLTPLLIALKNRDLKLTKILLDFMVTLKKGVTKKILLLQNLIKTESFDCYSILKMHWPNNSFFEHDDPILQAIYNNDLEYFEKLSENQKSISRDPSQYAYFLYLCLLGKNADIYNLLLTHVNNINLKESRDPGLLNKAIYKQQYILCKILLELGTDPTVEDCNKIIPWEVALKSKNHEIIVLILAELKKRNFLNHINRPLLNYAVKMKDKGLIKILLVNGADPNLKGADTKSALAIAITEDDEVDLEICELLLKHSADPNAIYNNKYNNNALPLHHAISKNNVPLIKLLLKYKADPNLPGEYKHLALDLISNYDIERFEILLQHGGKLSPSLSIRPIVSSRQLYDLILKYNALDGVVDNLGYTILHEAVNIGNFEMCKLCLDKMDNANINSIDNQGKNAFYHAVEKRRYAICELLLKYNIDLTNIAKDGYNPLHVAARWGDLRIVKLLLDHGIDPNLKTARLFSGYSLTALQIAATFGHLDLCVYLNNLFDVNNYKGEYDYTQVDEKSSNALSYPEELDCYHSGLACYRHRNTLLSQTKKLASNGDDIGYDVVYKYTPLEMYQSVIKESDQKRNIKELFEAAIIFGRIDVCEYLLIKNSYDYYHSDDSLHSLLELAAKTGRDEIVELLVKNGAVDNFKYSPKYTALYAAMLFNRPRVFKLLSHKLNGEYLKAAIDEGDEAVFEFLLNQNYDFSILDLKEYNFLESAIEKNQYGICKILLTNEAYFNFIKNQEPQLKIYTNNNCTLNEIYKLIIAHKNLFVQHDKWNASILCCAITCNAGIDACRMLLQNGINPNYKSKHDFAISLAVDKKDEALCKLLLQYGANPNTLYRDQKTILYRAIENQNYKLCTLLQKFNAQALLNKNDVKKICLEIISNKNSKLLDVVLRTSNLRGVDLNILWDPAIKAGHITICKVLIKYGANVNAFINGCYLLHYAIIQKNNLIIDLLLRNNVKINARDRDGNTALHIAAKVGLYYVGVKLIKHGAMINALNHYGHSPLFIAALSGKIKFCKLLLKSKANLRAYGDKSFLPLQIACIYNHAEIAEILNKYNSKYKFRKINNRFCHPINLPGGKQIYSELYNDISIENKFRSYKLKNKIQTQTAFKVAISLLSWEIKPNVEMQGLTALHIAIFYGLCDVSKILIGFHSDPNAISKEYGTPLDLAIKLGRKQIVELLLEHGADPHILNNDGETALDVAKYHNNSEIIKLLLKHNVDYNNIVSSSNGNLTITRVCLVSN